MATITAQVVLAMNSGLTEDFVSNTLHFTGLQTDDDTAGLSAALVVFYNSISDRLSDVVAQAGHLIKFYDTEAPKPNFPYAETEFTLTSAPAGATLPTEVACCLSMAAPRISGTPQARRRGRIYIGPLKTTEAVSGRPIAALRTDLLNAGEVLADTVNGLPAVGTGFLAVWSPTNQSVAAVKELSVDNAFDTQRRRGVDPTVRDVRVLTLPTV